MPVDLSAYHGKPRQALRRVGACAVYVVAPAEGRPCKIGIAGQVSNRLGAIQTGNWVQLFVHALLWIPDRPTAQAVEQAAHIHLSEAGLWKGGEWFDIPAHEARDVVALMASAHCGTVAYRWHDEVAAVMAGARQMRKNKSFHTWRTSPQKLAKRLGIKI